MSQARFLITMPFAALVAFALFYMMQGLIAARDQPDMKAWRGATIDMFRTVTETLTPPDEQRPEPVKPEPAPIPAGPPLETVPVTMPDDIIVAPWTGPGVPQPDRISLTGLPADADASVLVRISPVYPGPAIMKRVEGWCVVEFDITEAGTVVNVRVAAAQPAGTFDRACLQAATASKYRPKMVEGKPVMWYGAKVQYTFELED